MEIEVEKGRRIYYAEDTTVTGKGNKKDSLLVQIKSNWSRDPQTGHNHLL